MVLNTPTLPSVLQGEALQRVHGEEHRGPGAPGAGFHAQARLLPPGHEAGEPALHGPRTGQDRRLRPGQGDQVATSLHRLRFHQMVSS